MSEDNNVNKNKLSGLLSKLKKIKHLDIVLTVFFIAIILLIYFSTFSTADKSKNNNENISTDDFLTIEYKQTDELYLYASSIEAKLKNILSQIKDAGSINVIVGFDGVIEKEYAYTTRIEQDTNGIKTEIKTPVLITENGKTQPLILQNTMPEVNKIIIVSSGAKNTNVKLEILRAVQAIYDISNIQIFAGN